MYLAIPIWIASWSVHVRTKQIHKYKLSMQYTARAICIADQSYLLPCRGPCVGESCQRCGQYSRKCSGTPQTPWWGAAARVRIWQNKTSECSLRVVCVRGTSCWEKYSRGPFSGGAWNLASKTSLGFMIVSVSWERFGAAYGCRIFTVFEQACTSGSFALFIPTTNAYRGWLCACLTVWMI